MPSPQMLLCIIILGIIWFVVETEPDEPDGKV